MESTCREHGEERKISSGSERKGTPVGCRGDTAAQQLNELNWIRKLTLNSESDTLIFKIGPRPHKISIFPENQIQQINVFCSFSRHHRLYMSNTARNLFILFLSMSTNAKRPALDAIKLHKLSNEKAKAKPLSNRDLSEYLL